MGKELGEQLRIAPFGDALPLIKKIVFGIIFPEWQSVENSGRHFFGVDLPLFECIVFEKGFIEIASQQGKGLFFEVGGVGDGPVADRRHELVHLPGFEVEVIE